VVSRLYNGQTQIQVSLQTLANLPCLLCLFLAGRTAARSMIGCWHDTVVCPSIRLPVCLSVTICIMELRVDVGGYKLFRRVPKRALPIHFFEHYCCMISRLATNGEKAVGHKKRTSIRNC